MQFFKKILLYASKEPLAVLFILALIFSLGWHEYHRNEHFQECDSAGIYNMLYDFPSSGLTYTAMSYSQGNFLSKKTAEKILKKQSVQKIRNTVFSKYSEEFLTDKLTKLNLLAVIRYGYIQGVNLLKLPHQLLGFFAIPLSSTYSAGPGLVYSMITGYNTPYEIVMSRILFVNILVFHLAVLLIFLIMRRMKIQSGISAIAASLFLYSISLYSAGYHSGSTLWIFSSEIFLLWIVVLYWGKNNFLQVISLTTAILVYFNYLIIFLWAAILITFLTAKLPDKEKSVTNILNGFWNILKSQKIAIFFILLCGVLFFQPGQSARGISNLHLLPKDFYYIVLNFFAFYTHQNLWNIFQFLLGVSIIGITCLFLFKATPKLNPENSAIKHILAWFLIIFLFLVLIKILNFVPTRHILFLSPVWIIGIALALEYYSRQSWKIGITLIFILINLAGLMSILIRTLDAKDNTANIVLSSDIAEAGVYDCSYNLTNRSWKSSVPVDFINPKTFLDGKTYLYLSQVRPFSYAMKQWQEKFQITYGIISNKEINKQVYFTAFNPDLDHLLYSRPNSLYETKFEIYSIRPK